MVMINKPSSSRDIVHIKTSTYEWGSVKPIFMHTEHFQLCLHSFTWGAIIIKKDHYLLDVKRSV